MNYLILKKCLIFITKYKVLFLILLIQINTANALTKKPISVNVVLSSDSQVYYDVVNSIDKHLTHHGYSDISFNTMLPNEVGKFNKLNTKLTSDNLIITIGIGAASAVFKNKILQPVISVFVPEYSFKKLIKSNSEYASDQLIGVIYLDQPLKRKINFVRLLKPDAKKIGIPVGRISSKVVTTFKNSSENNSFELKTITIDDTGVEASSLNKLITQSDVILAIPDPIVHQPFNAKRILYNSYKAKKPVIAFSKAYVTAGALASIYSTPDQIGKHTAEKVNGIFKKYTLKQHIFSYPKYFSISINKSVAKMLGIPILETDVLLNKLKMME